MGRYFGRRPDRTEAYARAVRGALGPGEEVVAGVDVQTPGTTSAALQGGLSAGTAGAIGSTAVTFRDGEDSPDRWSVEAVAMGLDLEAARPVVWAGVVLTSSRLLLVLRSRFTRRVTGVVGHWPVAEIDRIEVPRRSRRLTVHRGGRQLTFELALDHRFRPSVYDELDDRLAAVKRGWGGG